MYFCTRNNETTFEKVNHHISFLYAFSAIIWQFLCLYGIQTKSGRNFKNYLRTAKNGF